MVESNLSKIISTLGTIAVVPILLLNFFGLIVAGIWILFLGQWEYLVIGILELVFGSFILSLFLAITWVFALPAVKFYEKNRIGLGNIFGILALITTYTIISSWCLIIFRTYLGWSNGENLFPFIILSYGVAMGVLSNMARHDQNDEGTMFTLFFAQFSYLAMLLVFLISRNFNFSFWIFITCMLLGLCLQVYNVVIRMRIMKKEVDLVQPIFQAVDISCFHCGTKDEYGGIFCASCGENIKQLDVNEIIR